MPLACMPKCPLSQHSQQQCYQKSVARCKLLWETRKVGKEKVCKKVWKAEYKLMMGLKAIRMLLIGSQKYKKRLCQKSKKLIRIWGISIRLELVKKLGGISIRLLLMKKIGESS